MVAELTRIVGDDVMMNKAQIEEAIHTLVQGADGPHDLNADMLNRLKDIDPEGPYHFVNLLKYKKMAEYPADHPNVGKEMRGVDAYNLYGAVALQQVIKRGGRLMHMNRVKFCMDGSDWDTVATMEYQSIGAFLDMLLDPKYQAALVHREAGIIRNELLVSTPLIKSPLGAEA